MWLVVTFEKPAVIAWIPAHLGQGPAGLDAEHRTALGATVPRDPYGAWLRGPGRAMFAVGVPEGDGPFAPAARHA